MKYGSEIPVVSIEESANSIPDIQTRVETQNNFLTSSYKMK